MSTFSRVEKVCGVLTGVSATLASLYMVNVNVTSQILAVLLLHVFPAVLVVIGSSIHSTTQKRSSFLILLVGSLVLLLQWVPGLLGSFYFYGLWGGLLVLTPGVMAAMTIVAAWASEKSK